MNYIDFLNLGGNPMDQQSFEFMQSSYRSAFAGIAAMCGEKVIISGINVNGNNVSNGWLVYNGELIPFIAGGKANDIIIDTIKTPMTFQDQLIHDVEITKVAKCGSPGDFPFADLIRLSSLKEDRWQSGDIKHIKCDAPYIAANFDNAGIGMNEREGWKICTDATGRMLISYDPNDPDFTIGNAAGAKTHTLTRAELPHIQLNSGLSLNAAGNVNDSSLTDPGPGNNNPIKTDFLGDGNAFNIMSPYLVILVIEKI